MFDSNKIEDEEEFRTQPGCMASIHPAHSTLRSHPQASPYTSNYTPNPQTIRPSDLVAVALLLPEGILLIQQLLVLVLGV